MVKMTETDYMEIYVNTEKDVKFIPLEFSAFYVCAC